MKNVISFVKSYRVRGYECNEIIIIVSTVYNGRYYEVISRIYLNMFPVGYIYAVLGSGNTLKECKSVTPYWDKIGRFKSIKPLLCVVADAFTSYISSTFIFNDIVEVSLSLMRRACIGGVNSALIDCRNRTNKYGKGDKPINELVDDVWHYPLPKIV